MDERISRCASLPKEQGSSDNLLMKAFPQTYQNLAFTLLPRANQSSWLFILVAAVVVYLVLPPLLFVIVSSIMPPAEEIPRIPTLQTSRVFSNRFPISKHCCGTRWYFPSAARLGL